MILPIRILFYSPDPNRVEPVYRQLLQGKVYFDSLLLQAPEKLPAVAKTFQPEVVIFTDADVAPAEAVLLHQEALKEVPILIITDPAKEAEAIKLLSKGAECYLISGRLERLPKILQNIVNSSRWKIQRSLEDVPQKGVVTEDQYRLLFQKGPLPKWIFDKKTFQILDVNEAAIRHYGYSREEFLRMNLMDLRPKDHLPEFYSALETIQAEGGELWISHAWHLKKDTSLIKVDIFGFNLLFQNTECAMVICQDITEREAAFENVKRAEQEALKASAEKEIILESIGDAFYAFDTHWNITYWNKHASTLLGVSKEEALGHNLRELFPDAEDFYKYYFISIREKKVLNFEEYFERTSSWYEVNVYPSADGLSVYFRDITERKKVEMELRDLNRNLQLYSEELTLANKGLEQFSYIVSHNLRAPVANILGLGDMLKQNGLDQELKNRIQDELVNNVGRLDMVISDLNTILENKGDISQKRELVSLNQLVLSITSGIESLIQKEQVEVLTDFSEKSEFISIKPYLYSIFQNLIFNSIKYRHPNRPPRIEIYTKKLDGKVLLIFQDNGIGIDLERKGNQVFGMYKRFHNHVEGKGMGLYMVKTQVELLGGKISVQSEVNKGTIFLLEFPLDEVDAGN